MTLVFHEIAQQEGITVSDQEYEDRLNELAKQYNYENTDDIVSLYSEEMIREENCPGESDQSDRGECGTT